MNKAPVYIRPASRTDIDVNAYRMAFGVTIRRPAHKMIFTPKILQTGLNYFLRNEGENIRISDVYMVRDDFDARVDSVSK
jgi:tRNA U38,U39,U40 pseudouridine synthase TruA